MRTEVRCRVAVAGAELRMLVLAPQPDGCVGVDLESGAFVRAIYPPHEGEPLEPFDVTTAPIGAPLDPPDTVRPEAVPLARAPEPDELGTQPAVTERKLVDGALPAEAALVPAGAGQHERALRRFDEGERRTVARERPVRDGDAGETEQRPVGRVP